MWRFLLHIPAYLSRYLAITVLYFGKVIQYRTELSIYAILDSISPAVMFFVWAAVFQGQDTINGLTLDDTLQYFILVGLLMSITDVHFEEWRSQQVRDGKIDFYLIKPYSFTVDIVIDEFVSRFLFFLLYLPAVAIMVLLGSYLTGLSPLALLQNISLTAFIPFLFLVLGSYILNVMFGLVIVYLTFWFEGSQGLEHFKWLFISIFSGSILPLEFMPTWLLQIVERLPFQYLYAVPIQVLQGRAELMLMDIFWLCATIATGWLLLTIMWNEARKQYAAVGG